MMKDCKSSNSRRMVIYGMMGACIASITCVFSADCYHHSDTEQEAIKVVLPQLDDETASNLVVEALLWIQGARAQPNQGLDYRSSRTTAPTAFKLGSDVWVEHDAQNAWCMVVQVPVSVDRFRSCEVYLTVKPEGGFTNGGAYVRYNDQIGLMAKVRK